MHGNSSNIGNFGVDGSIEFLRLIYDKMHKGDYLLLATDLKKDPKVILPAYNDTKGITARFNLNLLHRINKELEANIDVQKFDHYPYYDPITGTVYSYLYSKEDQDFSIMGENFHLDKHEFLHTEVSQKYNDQDLQRMENLTGFLKIKRFYDERKYYCISLWTK